MPNDRALRTLLLSEAHDSSTASHTGVAATFDRLRRRVYWAGMYSDVHDYVVTCDSCQRNKVEQRHTAGLLRPPPVPDEPGFAINMDFVFGLPRTARGHTGYLSMTCRLSNWLQVGLCADEVSAEQAAELVFERWVQHYGLPAVIISDRDPRFTGRFWRALWRLLDTQLNMSTAGHPQTDGKAENRQRTATTALRHFVDFEQADWDMRLLHAVHAINHTRSASSGLTPFEVMFRRSPRLPLDVALEPLRARGAATASAKSSVPAATNFLERHSYLWAAARSNMLQAQQEQKRQADRHRREELFAVGDEVLLSTRDLVLAKAADQQRSSKLTARFVGPFRIARVINDNAYELELPPQLRVHPVQNVSKLRRYRRSPQRFDGRAQAAARPPPDFVDATGDGEYDVERIVAQRRRGRRVEYLIKWQGYPNEDCSWEAASRLHCPELLAEFHARQ
ncbi:MAG: DDE-type integrase/transposase/recombinase [Candidatus Eremiobacteraeota bacterium]|nr:DDE-type integrase/transposase/recombinase [Candidatus Eremiobacteraeota bacterium]